MNTIEVNKLDFETAWKFVKKVRTSYFLEKSKNAYCSIYNSNLQITFQEEIVTAFSSLVMPGSKVTEQILDIKAEGLKSGGEMFIYLITCPTEKSTLFKRIFQQQVTGIFISLKKIVEKSSDQDLVDVGKKVLNEIISSLEFQYATNIDKSKITRTENLTNVKGTYNEKNVFKL